MQKKAVAIAFVLSVVSSTLAAHGARAQSTPGFSVDDKEVSKDSRAASVAGNWAGTENDSIAGQGQLDLTVRQHGHHIKGIWSSTFSDSSFDNGGSLSGQISGSTVAVKLKSSVPRACRFIAIGVLVNVNEIAGTYSAVRCSEPISGSFDITRP